MKIRLIKTQVKVYQSKLFVMISNITDSNAEHVAMGSVHRVCLIGAVLQASESSSWVKTLPKIVLNGDCTKNWAELGDACVCRSFAMLGMSRRVCIALHPSSLPSSLAMFVMQTPLSTMSRRKHSPSASKPGTGDVPSRRIVMVPRRDSCAQSSS